MPVNHITLYLNTMPVNPENKVLEKIDYSGKMLTNKELENCTFISCVFSQADLSNTRFTDCEFRNCNFSMAIIRNTSLKDVKFRNCKLLGLNFNECNKFLLSLDFEGCILNLSSFYKLKLKNTRFINCSLKEVDFSDTDLTSSLFDNCDFERAIFASTLLEKADFRTSFNYQIDPENNKIKKARFSLAGVPGLLAKYNIEIV